MYELAGLNASSIAKMAIAALGDASEPQYLTASNSAVQSIRQF
jgi:hypothetical protein